MNIILSHFAETAKTTSEESPHFPALAPPTLFFF